MGRGIVQLFAAAGHRVRCVDAVPGAALQAADHVGRALRRSADKGTLTNAEVDAISSRIHACDALSQIAGCAIVIEAIVEDLTVKIDLFRQLEEIVPATAILATNTSSLSVSAIAGGCRHPERVAGLHFFNPVHVMKIAEIIPGLRTNSATIDDLRTLIAATGHRAVLAADQPGFLVNHAGRGLYTEGLRILEEQVAGVADIDTLLREAAGFRMGPFELLDLTGLDVSGKVMESIYEQFHQEPRFRPSSLVRPRIAAGLMGRKSARGWYDYENDTHASTASPKARSAQGLRAWIDPDADDRDAIASLVSAAGGQVRGNAREVDLIIVEFWGMDATGYCVAKGLDARRCVAVDPLPGLTKRRTLMLTAATAAEARDAAVAILSVDAVPVTVINDSAGFVVQRVISMIVNIAADIAQRRIAAVEDIEAAVTVGLGYPYGPLTWGDTIGANRVLMMLENMHATTGDPRYRPSPWLKRRARLGLSLLNPDPQRVSATATLGGAC
jgi:3-hydroxybutyryl-CoA dehydrogenase